MHSLYAFHLNKNGAVCSLNPGQLLVMLAEPLFSGQILGYPNCNKGHKKI